MEILTEDKKVCEYCGGDIELCKGTKCKHLDNCCSDDFCAKDYE